MRNWLAVLFLVFALASVTATVAFASHDDVGEPQGSCADGFHLHELADHSHGEHGTHHHIGNDRDRNGDGYICGKHVGVNGNNHVHTDNNRPLPRG